MGLAAFNRARREAAEKETTTVEQPDRRELYEAYTVPQLKAAAERHELEGYGDLRKAELIDALIEAGVTPGDLGED